MCSSAFAQPTSFNQLNAAGKKNGYWKVFYNEHFELVTDSTKARYIDYEYYVNGDGFRYIYDKKFLNKMRIQYFPKDSIKDAKILNGEVLYYDKDNLLAYRDVFVDGIITKAHAYSYFPDSDRKYVLYHEEFIDFTKLYNNLVNSYYYEKKDYKIFREKWKIEEGYVIFKSWRKQKRIKL
jgi:hypothetical protein